MSHLNGHAYQGVQAKEMSAEKEHFRRFLLLKRIQAPAQEFPEVPLRCANQILKAS
jgi:hypothetical protein